MADGSAPAKVPATPGAQPPKKGGLLALAKRKPLETTGVVVAVAGLGFYLWYQHKQNAAGQSTPGAPGSPAYEAPRNTGPGGFNAPGGFSGPGGAPSGDTTQLDAIERQLEALIEAQQDAQTRQHRPRPGRNPPPRRRLPPRRNFGGGGPPRHRRR